MAQGVPANEVLWNNLMQQAKAKYPIKSPNAKSSFPINSWVKKEYERRGGTYTNSPKDVPVNMRDEKTRKKKKKQAKISKIKRDKKRAGLV